MTPLGKSLVFYLKYPMEMTHLYEEESGAKNLDLGNSEEAEKLQEMVRAVGDAAREEATCFLERCAGAIGEHFQSLKVGSISQTSRRSTISRDHYVQARLDIDNGRGGQLWYGVSLRILDDGGVIVPWLWHQGARAWEELVMRRLGDRDYSLAGDGVVFDRGTVGIARIPIAATDLQGYDIDSDPFVKQVVDAFATINEEDLRVIARGISHENDTVSPSQDSSDSPDYGWTEARYEARRAIEKYSEDTHADY